MANAIRALAMDAVEKAKSGHPGMPMGAADIATVLFTKVLKYDMADTAWPDRDRFVLSAGHGSMLLYALLYLTGERQMTLDEVKRAEHPREKGVCDDQPRGEEQRADVRSHGHLAVSIARSTAFPIGPPVVKRRWSSPPYGMPKR